MSAEPRSIAIHPDVRLALALLNQRGERRNVVVNAIAAAVADRTIPLREAAELAREVLLDRIGPGVAIAIVKGRYRLDARRLRAPIEAQRRAQAREGVVIVAATPEERARLARDGVIIVGADR